MSERSSNDGGRTSGAGVEGSANDAGAPVLSQIHVSCYVTAANRAAPVFEVVPEQRCVRVANKPGSDFSAAAGGTIPGMLSTSSSGSGAVSSAEWNFHSVFSSSSPSHAIDFFTEITLPALRTARDGINSNVVVWGIHPTQKYRLLFGKSVGGGGFGPQAEMAVNDVVELYGQLVGMLHAFFSQLDVGSRRLQVAESEPWRLGISSWIIVNSQTIDLLKTPTADASRMNSSAEPLTFVSLEAPSLATAFRIVQTAKTNRIVRKQNAENVHFFVRLALFHGGQVSTVHLVDLVDQKEFQDPVLIQEHLELYNILQDLRQPETTSRQSSSRASAPSTSLDSTGKMILSNFMIPLLTANAKTFLYANVIDSRTSLRESVQMLNAVANLRGFACVCKPLRGVSFEQLCFEASPNEPERREIQGEQDRFTPEVKSRLLLNRSASSPPLPAYQAESPSLVNPHILEKQSSFELQSASSSSSGAMESEAMSWLNTFAQRKRDILGGSIDTIGAITSRARVPERPVPDPVPSSAFENGVRDELLQENYSTPDMRPSISDLYEQLRESLEDVKEIELGKSDNPRVSHCSLHSLPPDRLMSESYTPLPIVDQNADQEDFAQVGYSRRTIGSIMRHQTEQPQQRDGELSSTWAPSNYATNNRPVVNSTSHYYEASYAHSRPEVDSVEPTEMSVLPSPAELSDPMPSSASSKPDPFTLEALKKAGISPCVMEPPNVDGLDVKMAQRVQAADATLLRKNYDALLSIVREQQQAKEAAEARAAEAVQDQEETRAMFEVQIENMKLANVGLRSKLRALENRTSLPQVFKQYEQELCTLHAQVQDLQTRNVALELRASGLGGAVMGASGSSVELKKKYRQVVEEKLALEREVMEHRKRERQRQVYSRLAGESTRRVDQLSRDLNNKEDDLVATRLSKQRLSAEMNQALEKADQLHHDNEKLLQEKAATTEELLATRMYLASLENEKKKASILDRFVEKHGDRMNKLRQNGQFSSGSNGESWRRDQYARECEDKLLAAVKRSLPNAVPLCNKILRRLEMQELSLREFSEREVDFINLLVELVSDQPTVSLKHMIEQEMNKLQS
ncbi:hypothetical protein PC129_g2539 [Phytophthora cactorum]|uniref:Kinesin motor domain-containing protein n=2 Tax=Phytophthora cactorum TaxID=29920 RepID=A0A329RVZ4_9STRA|nr:hypothetical protein Pcac1_g317 [Phytophthora cactorum]KAG2848758.1 hypothetical protein PC111_g250 [Phytophthora cactorum]KAG2849151.1 hypothetical protein PC112_g400 [Phytophthora cactorum]KAG2869067.1 hypothetical protein PC113_g485 [Phytophthora cactorum]KAG2935057.1 hypothetical protein PC114_g762 [Phytophthora cactorum]